MGFTIVAIVALALIVAVVAIVLVSAVVYVFVAPDKHGRTTELTSNRKDRIEGDNALSGDSITHK
jgi:hypothetical protein